MGKSRRRRKKRGRSWKRYHAPPDRYAMSARNVTKQPKFHSLGGILRGQAPLFGNGQSINGNFLRLFDYSGQNPVVRHNMSNFQRGKHLKSGYNAIYPGKFSYTHRDRVLEKICADRKKRREALFAKAKIGNGKRIVGARVRSFKSKIKC